MNNLNKKELLVKTDLLQDEHIPDEYTLSSTSSSYSISSEDELSIQSDDDEPLLAYSLFDDFTSTDAKDVWLHMSRNFNFSTENIKALKIDEYGMISLVNYLRIIKNTKGAEAVQLEWQNILNCRSQWKYFYQSYLISTMDDKLVWDRPEDLSFEDDIDFSKPDNKNDLSSYTQTTPENPPKGEFLYKFKDELTQNPLKFDKSLIEYEGHHEEEYFDGYSKLQIHREMILDHQRTSTYRDFMIQNADLFKDKIVLDVGCGTGILSIFAAQAGASLVVAVDASDKVIKVAQEIIKLNKMQSRIKTFCGKIQDLDLYFSENKQDILLGIQETAFTNTKPFYCDIIISEWMGYALLFESMIFPVLSARDRYLKEDGYIFPNIATIGAFGCNLESRLSSRFNKWSSMYGLDLSPLQPTTKETLHTPEVMTIEPELIKSQAQEFLMINLQKVKPLDISNLNYNLEINPFSSITSIGLYFNCYFIPNLLKIESLPRKGTISKTTSSGNANYDQFRESMEGSFLLETGPLNEPTHWKQTFLHLSNEDGSLYKSSEPLKLNFGIYPRSKQGTSLLITIGIMSKQTGAKRINCYELI